MYDEGQGVWVYAFGPPDPVDRFVRLPLGIEKQRGLEYRREYV